jgi:hypothetical protein
VDVQRAAARATFMLASAKALMVSIVIWRS